MGEDGKLLGTMIKIYISDGDVTQMIYHQNSRNDMLNHLEKFRFLPSLTFGLFERRRKIFRTKNSLRAIDLG